MQVHPFTIFGRKDLAAIQSGLDSIVSMWSEKWLVATAACPAVTSVKNAYEMDIPAVHSDNTDNTSIGRKNNNAFCKLAFSAQTPLHIYRRATGDSTPKAAQGKSTAVIETQLAIKILDDLLKMILADEDAGEAAPQGQQNEKASSPSLQVNLINHKGSGTVIATIEDQDCSLHLVLSQALAKYLASGNKLKGKAASLASRKSVIGHGKMKLRVTAGDIELRLSDLLDLKPGHVMLLNQKIDQPFVLETADTQTRICDAYLGQRDGNKAIQLINQ